MSVVMQVYNRKYGGETLYLHEFNTLGMTKIVI